MGIWGVKFDMIEKRERDPENGKPRVNLTKKTRWELSRIQ
jgi:hypothetical protein